VEACPLVLNYRSIEVALPQPKMVESARDGTPKVLTPMRTLAKTIQPLDSTKTIAETPMAIKTEHDVTQQTRARNGSFVMFPHAKITRPPLPVVHNLVAL